MRIVVLAQTPPPVHGQSLMVRQLLETLQAIPGMEVEHVNLALSRNFSDVGRARGGKMISLLTCARQYRKAVRRFGRGRFVLYYVPAPLRAVPLVRDSLLLPWARKQAGATVLHWHAGGMAAARGNALRAARLAYQGAELSLVLDESLRADAFAFEPQSMAVLPNTQPDHFAESWPQIERERAMRREEVATRKRAPQILFMSALREEKGLLRAVRGVDALAAESLLPPVLHCAGVFPDETERRKFEAAVSEVRVQVRHHGFVEGPRKTELLRLADVLLLPTRYPHEAKPLVILEALSAGLPVAATDWRGIPSLLPDGYPLIRNDDELLPVLRKTLEWQDFAALRQRYLKHFSPEIFEQRLQAVLLPLQERLESADSASVS